MLVVSSCMALGLVLLETGLRLVVIVVACRVVVVGVDTAESCGGCGGGGDCRFRDAVPLLFVVAAVAVAVVVVIVVFGSGCSPGSDNEAAIHLVAAFWYCSNSSL